MTKATDTRNWQVSISDSSAIVEGAEDIGQCVYTILATMQGTDPLRPGFGSKIFQYIDRPINEVRAKIMYEATDAIGKWEKRLRVKKIRVTTTLEGIRLQVVGAVVSSASQITIDVNI
ncbi:MAG: GPW/gp25 family protein [Alistipes sp.]|nr:GPW/gp25 family protein [Alistipes sp.]